MLKTPQEIIEEYAEKQKIREQNVLANRKKSSKTDKKKLLTLQGGSCAHCQEPISGTDQVCFDKQTKKIVCRTCMTYLSFRRKLRIKDITEEQTKIFEGE